MLSSRQEQSSSQVQAIVSRLTAMETHLKEITNSMAKANEPDSLPASRSRQRVSASVRICKYAVCTCVSTLHISLALQQYPHYVYVYAEKGEGIALCPRSPVPP